MTKEILTVDRQLPTVDIDAIQVKKTISKWRQQSQRVGAKVAAKIIAHLDQEMKMMKEGLAKSA
jgi:hypothetical protein